MKLITSIIEDTSFMNELIHRWDSTDYSWNDNAQYCHGAAMISYHREIIEELGFLSQLAHTIGKSSATGNRERLAVLAIKHCPAEHHDWEEIKTLTRRYLK